MSAAALNRVQLYCFPHAQCNPDPSVPCPLPVKDADHLPRAPILVLRFAYICPDRQLRRYAVLEPDAHAAAQVRGRGCWEGEVTRPRVQLLARRLGLAGHLSGVHLLTAASGPPSCRSSSLC